MITALTSWLAGAEPAAAVSAELAGDAAAGSVQSIGTPALWTGFTITVAIVMAVDLFFMSRSDGAMSKRAAVRWTAVWVSTALLFAAAILFVFPHPNPELTRARTMEFLAAYLIEYSLSVDNLFVFMLLFHAFRVPEKFQPRVLFWGIFGAVVLRGAFIFAGTALLQRFHFLIYLFGAFLIYTGITLVFGDDDEETDVSENRIVKLAKRFIRVSDSYDGHKFFTLQNGVRVATPLMLVLVSVELSDLVFALDSIPAVFGVSLDPFIVYTSNIFAILGLRSLYFLLSGALWGLRFLKPALGLVLGFVGVKMCLALIVTAVDKVGLHDLAAHIPHEVPTPVSLAVVFFLLVGGIALSVVFPGKKKEEVAAAEEVKEDIREVVTGDHPVPQLGASGAPPDGTAGGTRGSG